MFESLYNKTKVKSKLYTLELNASNPLNYDKMFLELKKDNNNIKLDDFYVIAENNYTYIQELVYCDCNF